MGPCMRITWDVCLWGAHPSASLPRHMSIIFYASIRIAQKEANLIFEQTRAQTFAVVVLVNGLASLIALWISSYLSHPVGLVIAASKAVEAGKFCAVDLREVEKRKHELGGLASVFSRMREQVRNHEDTLKEQVKDLRIKINLFIEIDQTRKAKQVREIRASEYFENLRKRVQFDLPSFETMGSMRNGCLAEIK